MIFPAWSGVFGGRQGVMGSGTGLYWVLLGLLGRGLRGFPAQNSARSR